MRDMTQPGLASELKANDVEHIEVDSRDRSRVVLDKRLLRRIDLRVIPILVVLFAFSLIDRNVVATARVAGMGKDLELTGNKYSIALLAVFPLYILIELPSNFMLRRISVKALFFGMVLCWGTVAMCHAFVQTFSQLVAVRVLLGLFEGSFQVSKIMIHVKNAIVNPDASLLAYILYPLGTPVMRHKHVCPSGSHLANSSRPSPGSFLMVSVPWMEPEGWQDGDGYTLLRV